MILFQIKTSCRIIIHQHKSVGSFLCLMGETPIEASWILPIEIREGSWYG
jgi:hypothetical protein